mgnify:CR=1 FL=1
MAERWCDYERCKTALLKFLYVCFKTGGEHKHDYADLGNVFDKFGLFNEVKTRSENKTGNKSSDYLRKIDFLGHESEDFC